MKEEINWLKKIWEALCNIAPSPEAVQSNWTENDNTKPTYIKNKPAIPDAQIQADWNQADSSKKDFIKNKPTLVPIIVVEVENIQAIPDETLDALTPGSMVIKITGNQKHTYIVSYKGSGVGEGICLSYNAAGYGETVSYDRTADGWVFNSVDVKTYGV